MSWELLPIELRVLILEFRNDARAKYANIIQTAWKNHQAKMDASIDILLSIDVDANGILITLFEHTANVLEFCCKRFTGRNYNQFWMAVLEMLNTGLEKDTEFKEDTSRLGKIYNRVEKAHAILVERFINN